MFVGRLIVWTPAILLLSAMASAEPSNSQLQDASTVLARLESRAEGLRNRQVDYPKLGALQKAALRGQLREIDELSAQVRAGLTPDADRLARALGGEPRRVKRVDSRDTRELAARLDARAEVVERRLRSGPKLGVRERDRLRADREEIRALRQDLERNGQVESSRLDPILPIERTRTPGEQRAELEIRKATAQRALYGPSKVGAVKRAQIREEIEALDALIAELESRR